MESLVTFALTTLAYFATIYPGQDFGSVWEYVAALTAGTAGQLAINWQLMPWSRSYRPEPAAAA